MENLLLKEEDYVKSFIDLNFSYFKKLCDITEIKLDNIEKYISDKSNIIKYKLDCLTDYIIFAQTNGTILCIGQNNIFNITELHPCQIYYMRINYKSFTPLIKKTKSNNLFEFNPSNKNQITVEYLDELKIIIKQIIIIILDKLNFNIIYDDIKLKLKKINNTFIYDEILYPNNKNIVTEFKINSPLEKDYWIKTVKYFIDKINNGGSIIDKVQIIKNIYNINHKYIHIIKNMNISMILYNKIDELKIDLYNIIYDYIYNLDGTMSLEKINELYANINICLSCYNSFTRYLIIGNYYTDIHK
jgi:hypothetical protein